VIFYIVGRSSLLQTTLACVPLLTLTDSGMILMEKAGN
jgi:hypothetical protein